MARYLKGSNATGVGRVAWGVGTFLLEDTYADQSPAVKQQIIDMGMNASGIRDTARVLRVSPTTILKELKKGT
jgi:transposase-like protein